MPFKDPEKQIESQRKYRRKNQDKIKAYNEANKIYISEYMREYHEANKEKANAKSRLYYQNNKDKHVAYKVVNKDHINSQRRVYSKTRKVEDPVFKLTGNIRSLVVNAFKRKGWGKRTKTQEILGCDFNTLQNHLILSAIQNYGSYVEGDAYHIDHIIPIAMAENEEDVIRLNHWTNLQWLTPEDNMKKGPKTNWALNKK